MDPGRAAQLRRTCRTDCGHSPHRGPREALGRRAALPPCTQLLHVVARARGSAAGHVFWLAPARHPRSPGGRDPVHSARSAHHPGPELPVRDCREHTGGGWTLLRTQTGRAGRGAGGSGTDRTAGAGGCAGGRARGARVHCPLRIPAPVSVRGRGCGHPGPAPESLPGRESGRAHRSRRPAPISGANGGDHPAGCADLVDSSGAGSARGRSGSCACDRGPLLQQSGGG